MKAWKVLGHLPRAFDAIHCIGDVAVTKELHALVVEAESPATFDVSVLLAINVEV